MFQTSVFGLTSPSAPLAARIGQSFARPAGLSEAVMPLVLMLAGVVMLSVSARIQVPFYPVPMTLQTLAVMMIAMSYGAGLASTTMFSYLAAGYLGAPVFAGGAGFAYMAGPTGGYLIGFFAASLVLGALADRGWTRSWQTTAVAMLAGTAIIYLFGLGWLSQLIGFDKAVLFGLLPFVYGDLLKMVIAAFSMPFLWKMVLWLRGSGPL